MEKLARIVKDFITNSAEEDYRQTDPIRVHKYVDTFTSSIMEDSPVLVSHNLSMGWSEDLEEELEASELKPEWEEIIEGKTRTLMDDFLEDYPQVKAFTDKIGYSPIESESYRFGLAGAYTADIMDLDNSVMKESVTAGLDKSLEDAGLKYYRNSAGEVAEIDETLECVEAGFEDYGSEIRRAELEDEIDRWSPITGWTDYEEEING
ncbi:MAG: hypothetical protein ACI9LV_000311 [Candidatus Nanohaloarchaea archaeon]|jgi:hypothetical protein